MGEDAKKSWEDRKPPDFTRRRYVWRRDEYDLSWIVRTVRAKTQLSTVRFALLVGSNHSSIVRCERRQRALRMSTLEAIKREALKYRVEEVIPFLDTEILLARKRSEKGGWR